MTQPDPNGPFALQTRQKNEVEYIPFGGEDKIKLSVKIIQDLIAVPTRSGKGCSERDAMKFLMLCRSRGLNPFEMDAYLIGYDGKDGPSFSLITAFQAFLKRAELHPEYDGLSSGIVIMPPIPCAPCRAEGGREVGTSWHICSKCNGLGVVDEIEGNIVPPDTKLIGGWAKVHFKNRKVAVKKRLSLSTFQQGYGRWQIDAAGMINKCASAAALREAFPTKMGGMLLREEDPEIQVQGVRVDSPVDLDPGPNQITGPTRTADSASVVQEPTPEPEPEKPKPTRAPKEPKPAAAPSPLATLQAQATLEGISEGEIIEILVRKNRTPPVVDLASVGLGALEWAAFNFEVIASQIRIDRKANEAP